MDIRERQRLYKEAVAKHPSVTANAKLADAFGVSNSAKVIGAGLFAFNVNFNTFSDDVDQVVVHCLLRFPPEDEIYFSIFVESEIAIVKQRLDEMRASGTSRPRGQSNEEEEQGEEEASSENQESPDGLAYTNNNKNVKGYIATDGRLYLRNKGYWDTMPENLASISHPVAVDRILFSIWPPDASARRSQLAREFVGYLGRFIGREKVHELVVWPDTSVNPLMQRLPHTIAVSEIRYDIEALGGHYIEQVVERYHAALNFHPTKHFAILAGLSGTGKTQLALKYARAIHGIVSNSEADPFLYVCPVRPDWTDPTGLTGYNDVLTNRYVVPAFLEAVLVATARRESPVFVVLDEMNLARVEYYFSDVLSAIETGEPIQLHSNAVPLEGSTGGEIPAKIYLPPNLYITGTINVDETTHPVSDKVLDRASLIDMSKVDLGGFFTGLATRNSDLGDSITRCRPVLDSLHQLLAPHRLAFGYRVAEEFIRYHSFATASTGRNSEDVIGEAITQKILVRLRGTEAQRPLLEGLRSELASWPAIVAVIERLMGDLDETGSFQNNR